MDKRKIGVVWRNLAEALPDEVGILIETWGASMREAEIASKMGVSLTALSRVRKTCGVPAKPHRRPSWSKLHALVVRHRGDRRKVAVDLGVPVEKVYSWLEFYGKNSSNKLPPMRSRYWRAL